MIEASAPAPPINVRRAAFYFGLVYFMQGVCQLGTLVNQPLRMYLAQVAGLDGQGVARFLFVATIPWMIKPIYGLVSDFVPLFGYRRKSYLILLNLLAAGAFAGVTSVHSANTLLIMLTLTGFSVAASDVIVDAMMVQAGQETGRTRLFQGAQWFSFSLAKVFATLGGAYICAKWEGDPKSALKTAAMIAACVPLIVATLTWLLTKDQRVPINLGQLRETSGALLRALTSVQLWLVVVFLFLIHFVPGVSTAMFSYLEEKIGLSYSYRAVLTTFWSIGRVGGALVFMIFLSGRMSTRLTVIIGLVIGAAGLLPMMLITGKTSAAVAYATWGFTGMIAALSQLTVAAEACPKRVEAVVFAALMSINNLAASWSDVVGSDWYETVFDRRIQPLMLISAGFTASGLLFIPFLRPSGETLDTPARPEDVVRPN